MRLISRDPALATGMFSLDTMAVRGPRRQLSKIDIGMQSTDGNQLWCPGQSLWSLITEHVLESELPNIIAALGHTLVDTYTEVHSGAEMLHKMWQETQQRHNSSRAATPLPCPQRSLLADPPVVKDLVRAEVKMLLQTLQERLSEAGRDGEELLFRYKPETVDYALSHLDGRYRNRSSHRDADNGSRPSSQCSVRSSAEDEIEAMRDKLNITDIDQVVDRLRSILTDECKALSRLVKHLQGNIKQTCRSRCEFPKSEPSLAELKELRGAIQTDLELCPPSFEASSPLPLKGMKNKSRLPAGRRVSGEPLQGLSTASVPRPHKLTPLCHTKPRPPPGTPPTKTKSSKSSFLLSENRGQDRSTSAPTGPRKTQTPVCNRITTSGRATGQSSSSPSGPDCAQKMVKTSHHFSVSLEQDSAGLHRTLTPGFKIKPPKNSPTHESHLSSQHSIQRPSRECDLSPQMERKSSPAWRSGNISTIPSSRHGGADSYGGNITDRSESTTEKSKVQNRRRSSICGGSSVSTTEQAGNVRRKNTSEGLRSCLTENHSVVFETGGSPAQTDSRNNSGGIARSENCHLGKDDSKRQSSGATCTHPASVQINGRYFTSPKRPLEGTTGQRAFAETRTELEFIGKFYQTASPAKVST